MGRRLYSRPEIIDNGMILIANGRIQDIGRKLKLPPNAVVHDYGDVTLLPQLANCHTHLQLSWLKGKTTWHQGFTIWLSSLLKELLPVTGQTFGTHGQVTALANACSSLKNAFVGDIGGSLPYAVIEINKAAQCHNVDIYQFCEWFGFSNSTDIWPDRCRNDIGALGEQKLVAPCGHALYSTAPAILQKAFSWCKKHNRVFSFHLAESPDETELLVNGSGPLYELYKDKVLPVGWKAPGVRPYFYARQLGLLSPGVLAVHGTELNKQEIDDFAQSGAALAICARSNYNLGNALTDVKTCIERSVILCLGTDGLTSCADLNIQNEVNFLRDKLDLPIYALWRMATINGAYALGGPDAGLVSGNLAKFSIWTTDV